MIKTRFGSQPGHKTLLSQGRTVSASARVLGIAEAHLHGALSGRIRPSHEVREKLPEFLGVPLNELFTEDALGPPRELLRSGAS
jgi:transcriptional regulator with XRE-family HTH domain